MIDPVRHDLTRGTERSGWGVVGFDFIDQQTVKVRAFGLKPHTPNRPLQDFYFLEGEELVISLPDGAVLYEIVSISYGLEPYDLFAAELRYIQHLTGFKTIGLRNKVQRDRAISWGKLSLQRQHKDEGCIQQES
ncbi:MAG: hypothetical protein QM769_05220 [Pseudoxanthomonas sp.]